MVQGHDTTRRENVVVFLCGAGIFGGGSFVYTLPVLMDATIGTALGLTQNQMVSSSTAIFVGWALSSTPLGTLADRFGRKPVAVGSGTLAVVHLLGCAVARRR